MGLTKTAQDPRLKPVAERTTQELRDRIEKYRERSRWLKIERSGNIGEILDIAHELGERLVSCEEEMKTPFD